MALRRVLITGCRGQLGHDLVAVLKDAYEVQGVDAEDFDITDPMSTLEAAETFQPHIVLHTAAFTDVDGCESAPDKAMTVNATGTENVARACHSVNARMIFYSTDYVFDGSQRAPYTEEDAPNPQTVYGRSKLAGERHVANVLDDYVILRIAWLYGLHGRNFVKTMIELGQEFARKRVNNLPAEPLRVVNDQTGNLTWSKDVAGQTRVILDKDIKGLIHCTSEGQASWYDIARLVFRQLRLAVEVIPVNSSEFSRPAPRPQYSVLENARLKQLGCNIMPSYAEALNLFLARHQEELLACSAR